RLPVPAVLVLEEAHALALESPGDDAVRLARRLTGAAEGRAYSRHVVAVDDRDLPTEGAQARFVDEGVGLIHRGAARSEAIDVDHRAQVVELVERRELRRLPDGALGRLAVAQQRVDAPRCPVQLASPRHSARRREPLAEGAGGHAHPRTARRWMA